MEQQELSLRFEELSAKINECKSVINSKYIHINQVEEWSNTMKQCATELNGLFSDTLRNLSAKIM